MSIYLAFGIFAFCGATFSLPVRKEFYETPWGAAVLRNVAIDEVDPRGLDGIGGGNLIRELDMAAKSYPDLFNRPGRNLDSLSGVTFGGNKRYDPRFYKRNWDEIDHAGFNSFIKKRNFDEIDRSGFDGFVKKRNFDEIDRVGFGSFVKRGDPASHGQKN